MKENIYPALQLTDACNKRCKACLRIPGERAHKIHLSDFDLYLKDIKTLSQNHTIGFQFVTGGEPTIWKDQGKDVADLLIALSRQGRIRHITMPTNGKRFEDKDYVNDLVKRIASDVDHTIIIGISIAGYQENFSDGRCVPLENLMEAAGQSNGKVLPIALVTLSKKDGMSQRIARSYPHIIQRVTPLAPLGAGQEMMADCPSVSLGDNLKNNLGDFLPQFKHDVSGKLNLVNGDMESMPNATIMNRLSLYAHCGQSPFIDGRWHYCLPFRDNPDFDLAPLGHISETSLPDFIAKRPWLQSIRAHGLIDTVERYKSALSKTTREKLDAMFQPSHQVSVAYRGCMICKELAEIGVWEDIRKNAV